MLNYPNLTQLVNKPQVGNNSFTNLFNNNRVANFPNYMRQITAANDHNLPRMDPRTNWATGNFGPLNLKGKL